jgi:hypothetical protein
MLKRILKENKMKTGIFDYEVDKSKLTKNELIVQQAREDIESGKITRDEFSEIKSKYGNHKKITKTEFLALPIFELLKDDSMKEGLYRSSNDEIKDGDWDLLFNVKFSEYNKVDVIAETCQIINN